MKLTSKHDKQDEEYWYDRDAALEVSLERSITQSDRCEIIPHEEVMTKFKDSMTGEVLEISGGLIVASREYHS